MPFGISWLGKPGVLDSSAISSKLTSKRLPALRDVIGSPNNWATFDFSLSSTTTPQGKYRFSSDHRSEVLLGGVSTWLGDHLGIRCVLNFLDLCLGWNLYNLTDKRFLCASTYVIVLFKKRSLVFSNNRLTAHLSIFVSDFDAATLTTTPGVIIWMWLSFPSVTILHS